MEIPEYYVSFTVAPAVTVIPTKQYAKREQATVHFDCASKGHPKPHVAWLFNGERILLTERLSIHRNGSLFIQAVEESDAGEYTCQAENSHGKVKASAILDVYGKKF